MVRLVRSTHFEEVLLPESKALKGLVIADIVSEDATVGATVETMTDCHILLLTPCVPNRKRHGLAGDIYHFLLKVADSFPHRAVTESEMVLESGLTDVKVAENNHLCWKFLLMSTHSWNL